MGADSAAEVVKVENLPGALTNVGLFWMLTTPHEWAHAWVADRLGDDTPRREGRLTLNPLAHVDWVGTVILPAVTSLMGGGFLGWGKPVPTNPAQLRGGWNGLAAVALAGPASNVVFAALLAAVAGLLAGPQPGAAELGLRGAYLSLYLALFNLLPVPPLDGSKLLLAARLPVVAYEFLARHGFLVLIVAFAVTPLGRWLSRVTWMGTAWLFSLFP